MTKAELEKELKKVKHELFDFKKAVDDAIIEAYEETCSESHEHIKNFCQRVGISIPKHQRSGYMISGVN